MLKWGDEETIKETDYNWRIVTSAVDDIRKENRIFNEPSLVEQVIYGQEEVTKRRNRVRETRERRLDKLWRQLEDGKVQNVNPCSMDHPSQTPRNKLLRVISRR